MSEEILKALMQLFAIIARQDGALLNGHEQYVRNFLATQLNSGRVEDYMQLYLGFLNDSKQESPADPNEKARTSMKDSVRTLSICKKINKTLAQKQKTIVLIRLLEFFKNDSSRSANRIQIVETTAEVFKIEKSEFLDLKNFVFEEQTLSSENEILIGPKSENENRACKEYLGVGNYSGLCKFIYLKSIHLVILKYHGHTELFLNGVVIKSETIYLFPHGSTLRLPQASIYYSNIISRFLGEHGGEKFSFQAHITEHKFPNGHKALHELKIEESSGNLVGIMGASGSGKTTLLTLLSGQDKPSSGTVLINNSDLHLAKQELVGVIGYVPQDDLLMEDLTVYQNLYYNAKLCYDKLDETQIEEKIQKTLVSLGLEEIKNIRVGNALNKKISGGQRKRLNIALELLREPHIIFLDEPTSGLSSRDSENVMDLLKELTFKGKLIFVVIHQPSSDIFKMFDKMLILDKGGYAAYYGNPIESVTHFKKATHQINEDVAECNSCGSVNPETIFNLIELKEIDEYGNYTAKRRMEPSEFYKLYKQKFFGALGVEQVKQKIKTSLDTPKLLKQTLYFFLRDLFSKISNSQYVMINLLEVPVLVLFLSLIIRYTDGSRPEGYTYFHNYNIPAYFFMSIIAAMLVGLTISAEEIYRDQKILKREKFLNLSRLSYISSKVILLFGISLIQSLLFVIIGNLVLKIHIGFFPMLIMLFSVFCFANILGLILSSTFNSPVTIYIIIPLIIIPQLLLGGAMFSYAKLSAVFGGGHKVPVVANFMVSRWAYEGLAVEMFINNPHNRQKFNYDKIESRYNYQLVYFLPKIEELFKKVNADSLHSSPELKILLQSELEKNHAKALKAGFTERLPELKKATELTEYLQKLNAFYNEKYNLTSRVKSEFLDKEIKKAGGENEYELQKQAYYNDQLDEILTANIDKEKIVLENGALVQVIDPVYQDPSNKGVLAGMGEHFLSAHKYLFGLCMPTFYFNLLMVWLMNATLFVILYFDVFKRLMRLR